MAESDNTPVERLGIDKMRGRTSDVEARMHRDLALGNLFVELREVVKLGAELLRVTLAQEREEAARKVRQRG